MKKNFYQLLLLFITFHAEAQLQKGLFSVGVSPDYWSSPIPDGLPKYFKEINIRSNVNLTSQYFFMKNFAAEIGFIHNYYRNINSDYDGNYWTQHKGVRKTVGMSIGANYHYLIRKSLYLKTSLNYTFYKSNPSNAVISDNPNFNSYEDSSPLERSEALNLNINLVYFLSKKLALDLKLGGLTYYHEREDNFGYTQKYTQVNFKPSNWTIGLSFYPNVGKEKKKKHAKTDSTFKLNDNVLKGRTYFFPNGTTLDDGEVYIEPMFGPAGIYSILDIGLGKGFSISITPSYTFPFELSALIGNLKYARKISDKWSLSVNTTIWWEPIYEPKEEYNLYPILAATRINTKSEMSFGVGIEVGKMDYIANIGYTHKIGGRWAFTTDNIIYIDNTLLSFGFLSTNAFKYHVNRNFNLDFGFFALYRHLDEGGAIPMLKASYHFQGKKNKLKNSTKEV